MNAANRMSFRASSSTDNGTRVQPEIFKHRLLTIAEETLVSLQKIWKEAGYEDVECQRLLGDLLLKLKTTFTSELAAEQQILEHAKAEVEAKSIEYTEYCSQLGRVSNIKHLAELNYTDRLAELEKLITNISTEVSQREELLNAEKFKMNTLISCLGEITPNDNIFDGPSGTPKLSDIRLNLMKQYVADLEDMKNKRTEEVKTIAKDCYKHMSDMMYIEEGFKTMEDSAKYLNLDKQIEKYVKNGEFTIGLHKKHINDISTRLKSFVEEKEKRRIELGEVGSEIARLWTLLRIPSTERDAFQSSFKMNLSMETLCKGFDELNRLKEVRVTSMVKVIKSIRDDIEALWQEAGIELEETRRNEFAMFFVDIATLADEAVDLHESYCNELRKRVEELRPLLQKVARREAVVQERIELEHLQQNPERLTARGPNAREERKKEESMSNRVKNLEKITKELLIQITSWEETNGPFMFGGERYSDRVISQDDTYIETRDSLRNARKKKDGKLDQVVISKTLTTNKKQVLGIANASGALKTSGTLAAIAMKSNSTLPATPTHGNTTSLPPPVPINTTSQQPPQQQRSTIPKPVSSYSTTNANTMDNCEDENIPPTSRISNSSTASRDSDITQYTTFTEIKERKISTDSHTIVREV